MLGAIPFLLLSISYYIEPFYTKSVLYALLALVVVKVMLWPHFTHRTLSLEVTVVPPNAQENKKRNSLGTMFFIHGYPDDKEIFSAQYEHFHKLGWSCVAVDLPWFSDTKFDVAGYWPEDCADACAAALRRFLEKQQPVRKAVLVAHDWGADIAAMVQLAHPDLVSRVVYFDTLGGQWCEGHLLKRTLIQGLKGQYFHAFCWILSACVPMGGIFGTLFLRIGAIFSPCGTKSGFAAKKAYHYFFLHLDAWMQLFRMAEPFCARRTVDMITAQRPTLLLYSCDSGSISFRPADAEKLLDENAVNRVYPLTQSWSQKCLEEDSITEPDVTKEKKIGRYPMINASEAANAEIEHWLQLADKHDTFTAVLVKGKHKKWGMDIDFACDEAFQIRMVSEGPVNDWNLANPEQQIQADDYITTINGESLSLKSMSNERRISLVTESDTMNAVILKRYHSGPLL